MIEVANITSVQVTWNQPEGGLAANEYVVSYRHLNGRDGQCSSFQDGGSETVRAEREGGSYNSILNLQAFSVYCCTVTARKNNGALHNITSFNFTTNSTGLCMYVEIRLETPHLHVSYIHVYNNFNIHDYR